MDGEAVILVPDNTVVDVDVSPGHIEAVRVESVEVEKVVRVIGVLAVVDRTMADLSAYRQPEAMVLVAASGARGPVRVRASVRAWVRPGACRGWALCVCTCMNAMRARREVQPRHIERRESPVAESAA